MVRVVWPEAIDAESSKSDGRKYLISPSDLTNACFLLTNTYIYTTNSRFCCIGRKLFFRTEVGYSADFEITSNFTTHSSKVLVF